MILERLEKETGVSKQVLYNIVLTSSYRYKRYQIPKRKGGYRIIEHPTPDLKFLQRWLNREIFCALPIHSAAHAYRKGIGIAQNALVHAHGNYLLKIDFEDFFPSLTDEDIRALTTNRLMRNVPSIEEEDIFVIVRTVCKHGVLTIGAPSSPILSNAMLYDFDCFVSDLCEDQSVKYSRYADDLFLSTDRPNVLKGLLGRIRDDLQQRRSPRLRVNDAKTVFTSKKRRRTVTGVVLTPQGELSVGRRNKRKIRTLIHLYTRDGLSAEEISYLRGYLAFVKSVEPKFIEAICEKYGKEIIGKVMRHTLTSGKR